MPFNYNKLKGRIIEKCGTYSKFAETMGITSTTMSAKINGKSEFSQEEILKAIKILQLDCTDIPNYFFAN